jgi:hypothetical protein
LTPPWSVLDVGGSRWAPTLASSATATRRNAFLTGKAIATSLKSQ